MTISAMHTAWDLLMDKSDSLQYPSFLAEEKDFWLNQAISKFVKTRYSGFNAKGEGFEQSQKRIDDLRTLVREITIACTTSGAIKPNGYVLANNLVSASFTADPYWFSLGEEVTISYTRTTVSTGGTATKRVGVIEATADNYRSKIDNPLSEHILHYDDAKPLRLFYNNTMEFITDGNYTVTYAYIRYIKEPVTVVYNTTSCDLPDHTHDEIVKMAVEMALESVEQPRLNTFAQQVNTME